MGARKSRAPRSKLISVLPVFCLDADSLINLRDARLLRKLQTLVRDGHIKVPEGVFRELQGATRELAKTLQKWEKKYSIAENLDHKALELLPRIERTYGPPFSRGGKTYSGFWQSASGRRSADAQLVALAKTRGWIVISNDDSVHGACMLEGIECRRWEEIGRLLIKPTQPPLF